MPPTERPTLLLLDWDGTLTETSTLPLIASIATHPNIHPSLPSLAAAYSADLKRHDDTHRPANPHRTTLDHELTYLSSLHAVEKASIDRLEVSGIFENVRSDDIDGAAAGCWGQGTVTLRSGWRRLVGNVQRQGQSGGVAIVSVAWSRRFIGTLLRVANKGAGGDGVAVADIAVVANEIVGGGGGVLDRYFLGGRGVWSADDKAAVMEGLVGAFLSSGGGRPVVVFIGDSVTDLACLVKADVGVCIRDEVLTGEQEVLREVLERVGVGCVSIEDGLEEEDRELGKGKLWWARDFDEVCESELFDWKAGANGVT